METPHIAVQGVASRPGRLRKTAIFAFAVAATNLVRIPKRMAREAT